MISLKVFAQAGIVVTSPNGGESIARNGRYTIRWTDKQIDSVRILYSLDKGLNWKIIRASFPTGEMEDSAVGEYDWNVPDTTSEECLIKIESTSDSSIYGVSDRVFKIITIPRFSYFPLSPGNKWFFSDGIDGEIHIKIEVEKDTLLDDGHSYAKLNLYFMNEGNPPPGMGWAYLRTDSGKVIDYPSRVWLDYNMQLGDTVGPHNNPGTYDSTDYYYVLPYSATLSDVELNNVFGRYLSTYYFFTTRYDYFTYTDSIGFNTLWATTFENWVPEYLLGCEIDGKKFGITTAIKKENDPIKDFVLQQNYPNPFNPTTKINYSIPKQSLVTITVYDILGREVVTLVNSEKPAGNYEVKFNGGDLSSGIYFYNLKAGNYSSVKKMILLK